MTIWDIMGLIDEKMRVFLLPSSRQPNLRSSVQDIIAKDINTTYRDCHKCIFW